MLLYEPPVAVGPVGDFGWLVVEGMTAVMTAEVRYPKSSSAPQRYCGRFQASCCSCTTQRSSRWMCRAEPLSKSSSVTLRGCRSPCRISQLSVVLGCCCCCCCSSGCCCCCCRPPPLALVTCTALPKALLLLLLLRLLRIDRIQRRRACKNPKRYPFEIFSVVTARTGGIPLHLLFTDRHCYRWHSSLNAGRLC